MEQSKLAVAFANCHLAKSGRVTYPCSEEMSVRECTEPMNTEAYQTYTHFFTHTGHICYFIQMLQDLHACVTCAVVMSEVQTLGELRMRGTANDGPAVSCAESLTRASYGSR